MINIPLSQDIIDYSDKLVKENDFGQRGKFDGTPRQQFIGVLAENTVRDYLGFELIKPNGFDGGWDVEYKDHKADIKCMERSVEPRMYYVNNVVGKQIDYDATAFIFTSLNTKLKSFTVCGWIDKEMFKQKASFYKEGSQRYRSNNTSFTCEEDLYEIENKHLYNFE